ncbi:hypothetical protein [Bowmanella yangjiangensis]|uniref:Tail fiber protein n=1 Tax=Bowmanella yangjiangensis TaxID=2811230 RepID=A0ABS3D0C4_9ALTE|nr:hypothetical protein [Bowmanella yangjiangensis]MBN7822254.1 hypothetical protein [Bowmanella yangjiangensis]
MKPLNIENQVEGLFRFEAFKTDENGAEIPGTRRVASDWQKNLILDTGLNRMATNGDYLDACQVGSGSSTPANGQTALDSIVAGANVSSTGAFTPFVSGSAPYYVGLRRTYPFATGVATGNLSEVGVGWSTTGTTLFSRSLIKDSMGNPTSITILSDESLDVIYEMRYYAPPSDITGTIVATGNIGGSYDYILRSARLAFADSNSWNLPFAQSAGPGSGTNLAYSGDIGAVTGSPSGTSANIGVASSASYVSGSFQLDRIQIAAAGVANFGTGLRSMLMKIGIGAYQIQFDPAIPKTNVDQVELTIRLSWARRP